MVEAATEEFKRYGFEGATTAGIAARAGVTEAQIFRYFESKSALFHETVFQPIERHFLDFNDRHLAEIGNPVTLEELTRAYTGELQRFIGEHSDLLTSLVVVETYNAAAAHGVGRIDSLQSFLERAAAQMSKRIKGKPAVDPRLLVRVCFASVLASVIFKPWMFPQGLASDEQIRSAVSHFVLNGVSDPSRR
jgi:AcrR family transcriptional regulator